MRVAALSVLVAVTTACKDDEPSVPAGSQPSVMLTAGETGETTLSFTVTPGDAEACAWICLKKNEVLPDAVGVFINGTVIDAQQSVTVTAEGLDASTDYVILAAVSGNDTRVLSDPLEMRTDDPVVVYSITGAWRINTGEWLLESPDDPDPAWDEKNYAWGRLDGIWSRVPMREWCEMYMEEYNATEAGQASPITIEDVALTEFTPANNEHFIYFMADGTFEMWIHYYMFGLDNDPANLEWISGTYTYDPGSGELTMSGDDDLERYLTGGRVEKLNETELVFYVGVFNHYNTYALPIGSDNRWSFFATSRFSCTPLY